MGIETRFAQSSTEYSSRCIASCFAHALREPSFRAFVIA
jgi:hypothetical protein